MCMYYDICDSRRLGYDEGFFHKHKKNKEIYAILEAWGMMKVSFTNTKIIKKSRFYCLQTKQVLIDTNVVSL